MDTNSWGIELISRWDLESGRGLYIAGEIGGFRSMDSSWEEPKTGPFWVTRNLDSTLRLAQFSKKGYKVTRAIVGV